MAEVLVVSERPGSVVLSRVSPESSAVVAEVPLEGGFDLTTHPSLPLAYLTSGADGGTVVTVDLVTGAAHRLPGVGGWPCHLAVSPGGGALASANYDGGSVSLIELRDGVAYRPVRTTTLPAPVGGPGTDPERQDRSRPHTVRFADGGLLVTDLGTDSVLRLDEDLRLVGTAVVCPAGSGPRHLVADASGRLWVSLELSNQVGRVVGDDVIVGPATTAAYEGRSYPGDIAAAGPWVVMANRGADTVSVYDSREPGVVLVQEVATSGRWPASLAVVGDTVAVANRDSGSVAFFPVTEAGLGEPVVVGCDRPIALASAG